MFLELGNTKDACNAFQHYAALLPATYMGSNASRVRGGMWEAWGICHLDMLEILISRYFEKQKPHRCGVDWTPRI